MGLARNERVRSSAARIAASAALSAAIALTLFFIFPVYWLFIISFKTPEEIFALPARLVSQEHPVRQLSRAVQGRRCHDRLEQPGAGRRQHLHRHGARHHCAYSLVRFKTGGENLAVWIISQRMMPPVAIVFPIFLLYVWLGWVDTFTGSSSSTPPSACPM